MGMPNEKDWGVILTELGEVDVKAVGVGNKKDPADTGRRVQDRNSP